MRGKPLLPFAGIAVVGLVLMIGLSLIGVNQKDARLASEGDVSQPTQEETADSSGPMALGEEVYKASCIGCHGASFESPMANLTGLADRYSKEEVVAIIKEGIPGTSMPGGLVDEEKTDAVADYLLEATK